MFRSPSSGYPRPGGGAAGPAMWQWQNNNGSADPALTPTTTEGVDMLSMLGRTHTHTPLSRVSDLDPDSISSVDPYLESESGSRRDKMTHKSRKNQEISCFEVLDRYSA